MVQHAIWHHPTVNTIWTHKVQFYQLQCTGSKCSQLVEFSFIAFMSACVIGFRSIGSCSSTGLCAGLLITGLCFQLLLTTSLWHRMPAKGYENNFQEPVLWYRLSMFCQNWVTCPSIRVDPGIPPPGTRLHFVPGFRDPGSVLILGQETQYGNPYLICMTLIKHFVWCYDSVNGLLLGNKHCLKLMITIDATSRHGCLIIVHPSIKKFGMNGNGNWYHSICENVSQ